MNRWLSRLLPGLGLLLVFLSLMSALRPDPEADHRTHALAVRQIGHDYFLAIGDSTSRIPAVDYLDDDSYRLQISCDLDYDLLSTITASVLARMTIREDYHLTLEDCTTGAVFLGSFWVNPQGTSSDGPARDAACVGRDQEVRCADFRLTFLAPAKTTTGNTKYWLLGIGCCLILGGVLLKRTSTSVAEAPQTELTPIIGIRLGVDCVFDPQAQQLKIGESCQELTYREAKLLQHFTDHPNQVLARPDIHDAVWGEEGVIVGRSLDVFVSRLRKKLTGVASVEIKTIHGVGYQLLLS